MSGEVHWPDGIARGELLYWDGTSSRRVIGGQDNYLLAFVAGVPVWVPPSVGGGGTDDHGLLIGLADNDHPQYLRVVDLPAHPNAAAHDAMGLATDAELSTHAAAADPHAGYRLESADHSHQSTGLQGGVLADAAIPASIARDTEVTAAVTAHEGQADPHPGYTSAAELSSAVTAHEGLANPHPTYETAAEVAAQITTHAGLVDPHSGYRLESADHSHASTGLQAGQVSHADLTNLATGDPHTQYQRESEKSAASGYASLNASVRVPTAELGSGTANSTVFLRGDSAWAAPVAAHADLATHDALGLATDAELTTHAGAADPHTVYRLESADHSHASTGLQAGTVAHSALTGLTTGDPHTQYQQESEKAAASGYASLDSTTKVPTAQLGTGTADSTVFLRGDRAWGAPTAAHPNLATHDALGLATDAELSTHAGAADPHTVYRLESADHSHASTGLQGGTVAHSALSGLTSGNPHTQYALLTPYANYTPTITQGGTVTSFTGDCRYCRIGNTVFVQAYIVIANPGGAAAANVITITLPIAGAYFNQILGTGALQDNSAGLHYYGLINASTATTISIFNGHTTTPGLLGTSGFTAALAVNDVIDFNLTYEAA